MILLLVATAIFACKIASGVIEELPVGVQPLTRQQISKLEFWNESNEENIWELSGQFEGDMVLTEDQRNGIMSKRKWRRGILPYEIDKKAFNSTQEKLIEDALSYIEKVTCIKPRRKRLLDFDYVYVSNKGAGCWSHVGKTGRKQDLNLGKGCLVTGTIIHEFLHALGFHHQQSDPERDKYLTIYLENVKPGLEKNFDKYSDNVVTSFGEPYDYNSVMHYGRKAFSANGKDTIVPNDPNAQIGKQKLLSPIDINKINKMYNCSNV